MMITERVIWSKWIRNCHSFFPQMLSESWPRARHQGLTLCTGSHFSPGFPQLPAVPPFLPCNLLTASVAQALYQASDYRPSTTSTDAALFPSPVLSAFVFLTSQDGSSGFIIPAMSLLLYLISTKGVIWIWTDQALSQKQSWSLSLNWESVSSLLLPSLLWPRLRLLSLQG